LSTSILEKASVEGQVEPGDLPVTPKTVSEQVYSSRAAVILTEWREQNNQDRRMRQRFATWVFVLLSGQLIFFAVFVVLLGLGMLNYDELETSLLYPSWFGQIAMFGWAIVRYLFKERDVSLIHQLGGAQDGPEAST